MYFYIYKTNENEIQQTQLLEMCRHDCLHTWNGKGVYGLTTNKQAYEGLWIVVSATFFIWYYRAMNSSNPIE
jgi:hypothetical protein